VGYAQVFNAATGASLQVYQDPLLANIDPSDPPSAGTFANFGLAVAVLGNHLTSTEPVPTGGPSTSDFGRTFSGSVGNPALSFDQMIPGYSGGSSVALHEAPDLSEIGRLVGNPVQGIVNVGGYSVLSPDYYVPGVPSAFGESVAWLGDQLLIGAPGARRPSGEAPGLVYLVPMLPYSEVNVGPSGLTAIVNLKRTVVGSYVTFDAPTSSAGDNFGAAVAARGQDVLIGAPNTGKGGAAYLFDATGRLLFSMSNPSPFGTAEFGFSVAALGNNILVGAPDDSTRGTGAGAVYLFDGTTGALLQTFYSPHPQQNGHFGFAIAAYGPDRFFAGAPGDDPDRGGDVYLVGAGVPVTVHAGQVVSGVNFRQTLTPDFVLTAVPKISLQPGQTTTTIVSTTALAGFSGDLNLTASNSPGITTTLIAPALAVGDTATLTVTADPAAAGTAAAILLTATASDGTARELAIPVSVLPTHPDFVLQATRVFGQLDANRGSVAMITLFAVGVGGFQGPIDLSLQGVLAGENYHFSNPLEIGGSTTITFSADLRVLASPSLSNTVTVIATSGSLRHQTAFDLVVSATPSESLALPEVSFFNIFTTAGTLMNDQVAPSSPDPSGGLPPGTSLADFPYGFFSFEVHGVGPGQHVTLAVVPTEHLTQVPTDYWKFGSPGRDAQGKPLPRQWYLFNYDPVTDTGAEFLGDVLILHYVEGQRGDDDLTDDGVIRDPGGPAFMKARNISLSMSATPDPVRPGQKPSFAMTFTTTVTNHSSVPAAGVIVTDPLPAGAAFVSATTDLGTNDFNGSALVWNVGTLAPGASASICLALRPIAFGPIGNTARLSGASIDPASGGTVATATANPLPAGRLDRFITTLYVEILDRFHDPAGEAYWVGRIESGVDSRTVAAAIYGSSEHHWLLRHQLYPNVPLGWSYFVALCAEQRVPGEADCGSGPGQLLRR
jgi:uncharacterized repeat protein (TIGR01451 family)